MNCFSGKKTGWCSCLFVCFRYLFYRSPRFRLASWSLCCDWTSEKKAKTNPFWGAHWTKKKGKLNQRGWSEKKTFHRAASHQIKMRFGRPLKSKNTKFYEKRKTVLFEPFSSKANETAMPSTLLLKTKNFIFFSSGRFHWTKIETYFIFSWHFF